MGRLRHFFESHMSRRAAAHLPLSINGADIAGRPAPRQVAYGDDRMVFSGFGRHAGAMRITLLADHGEIAVHYRTMWRTFLKFDHLANVATLLANRPSVVGAWAAAAPSLDRQDLRLGAGTIEELTDAMGAAVALRWPRRLGEAPDTAAIIAAAPGSPARVHAIISPVELASDPLVLAIFAIFQPTGWDNQISDAFRGVRTSFLYGIERKGLLIHLHPGRYLDTAHANALGRSVLTRTLAARGRRDIDDLLVA